jgi:predicted metal-binding protein
MKRQQKSDMKNSKVVPFQSKAGISSALLQRLLDKGKTCGLQAITPICTEDIIIAEWVNLKCRYGCNRYNTTWCCPPATPGPDEVRKILGEYSSALLLEARQSYPEFYLNNTRKRIKQVRGWKGTVSLERLLFLEGFYKVFSLVGECCALCKECTYPENCRFPQEKRPSVESFSIDVIGTLQLLGKTPQVAENTNDSFSYYSIILLE